MKERGEPLRSLGEGGLASEEFRFDPSQLCCEELHYKYLPKINASGQFGQRGSKVIEKKKSNLGREEVSYNPWYKNFGEV